MVMTSAKENSDESLRVAIRADSLLPQLIHTLPVRAGGTHCKFGPPSAPGGDQQRRSNGNALAIETIGVVSLWSGTRDPKDYDWTNFKAETSTCL